jgi:hypothetical protein
MKMHRALPVALIALGISMILLSARLVAPNDSRKQYVCEPVLSLAPGSEDYEVGVCEEGIAYGPQRIAVDTLDNIYLLDCLNSRIQKFSSLGVFISSISDTRIRTATDMFVLPNGVIYVLDDAHRRITSYDQDGNVIESTYFSKGGKTFLFDRIQITVCGEILIGNIGQLHRVIKGASCGSREEPCQTEEISMPDEQKVETEAQEPTGVLIGRDKDGHTYFAGWSPNPEDSSKYQRMVSKYDPKDELLCVIGNFPQGYYSYGIGERDLAIDQNGDIFYLYTSKDSTIQVIQCSRKQ